MLDFVYDFLRGAGFAMILLLSILIIAHGARALSGRGREHYLIYPYLDLDEPGERGSYYQLAECP